MILEWAESLESEDDNTFQNNVINFATAEEKDEDDK